MCRFGYPHRFPGPRSLISYELHFVPDVLHPLGSASWSWDHFDEGLGQFNPFRDRANLIDSSFHFGEPRRRFRCLRRLEIHRYLTVHERQFQTQDAVGALSEYLHGRDAETFFFPLEVDDINLMPEKAWYFEDRGSSAGRRLLERRRHFESPPVRHVPVTRISCSSLRCEAMRSGLQRCEHDRNGHGRISGLHSHSSSCRLSSLLTPATVQPLSRKRHGMRMPCIMPSMARLRMSPSCTRQVGHAGR